MRRNSCFHFAEFMFRIGIDLGGTKIEGIVLNAQGVEVFRKRIPTERSALARPAHFRGARVC